MGSRTVLAGSSGDPSVAARQGAALFALSGALALLGIPSSPDQVGTLLLIALADFVIAALGLALPWDRWGVGVVALLALPGYVVLGVSTWAFGSYAAGVGPFYVLLFVWLGLHQSARLIVALGVPTAVAYAGGLVASGADPRLVGSTVVLVPVVVAVGVTISNRVHRLAAARDVIEQQEHWRGALMATLAHDVRTPLTTIGGALEILADDPELADHLRPLVSSAARQASRISSLSSNLLDSERIDEGRLHLDLDDVDVPELVRHVGDLLGVRATDLELDIEPGLRVRADRMRLEQMLVNLSTNALRHGRPPIAISAHTDGDQVVIRVRDHGEGVPLEDEPYLFARLSQADRSPESVGLGLWIVKMLAEAHEGEVSYRTIDPGAEFTVLLPQATAVSPA